MTSRLIHKEFLLFILLTSIIWLLLTIGKTERTESLTMYAVSPSSRVNEYYLKDSVIPFNIEVSASGINSLRFNQLKEYRLNLNEIDFIQKERGLLEVQSSNVLTQLNTAFRGTFRFTLKYPKIVFPCEHLERKKVPVAIQSRTNIQLPKGYKWIEELKCKPDSIEVAGAAEHLARAELWVELPEFTWTGGHSLVLPLQGMNTKVSSVDFTKVEVIGATALWIEKRFTKSIVVDQKMHDLEIWIAGPSQYLTNVTLEELVLLSTIESPTSIKIETEILKDKISLLSIQPNSIERFE
jgi:hypothetical protein